VAIIKICDRKSAEKQASYARASKMSLESLSPRPYLKILENIRLLYLNENVRLNKIFQQILY